MFDHLKATLQAKGFVFASGDKFQRLVDAQRSVSEEELHAFAESWASMPPDPYLARKGMTRRRRHAVFEVEGTNIQALPPRPHYQALEYNPLQGGISRHLEAIDDQVAASDALERLIVFGSLFFSEVAGATTRWDVEAHQFRIEASPSCEGQPTPEGHHRDGVDFVLVVMVRRENLRSGTTSARDDAGRELGAFTLTEPYDVALVDDRRVLHGVTPVFRSDPNKPGFRDVLVLTYRRAPTSAGCLKKPRQ